MNKKQFLLLVAVLFNIGCTQKTPFLFTGVTDINNFDIKSDPVYVFPMSANITDKNALNNVKYAVEECGLNIVDKVSSAKIAIGYTFNNQSYQEYIARPIFGKTGIKSINTVSNTTGDINGYSKTNGYIDDDIIRVNTSYSGDIRAKTNTTTSVNYDYGVVGYHDEFVNHNMVILNIVIINNKEIIGSYKIGIQDGTPGYLLGYLPALLPIVIGSNTDTLTFPINCNVYSSYKGDTDVECKASNKSYEAQVAEDRKSTQWGQVISSIFIASANSPGAI